MPPETRRRANTLTLMPHAEFHHTHRTGWLRAAVLGANDGILSTSSLLLGFIAANAGRNSIILAGIAGSVAGTMAMAAGEYVSVSSQADTEKADLAIERRGIEQDVQAECDELASIYVTRGLDTDLARQVASQLMAHDALAAHARDELGISETLRARPFQAAIASGSSFIVGTVVPLIAAAAAPTQILLPTVAASSLLFLALLGAVAARVGGANILIGAIRVLFWGILAMGFTAGVGALFGARVLA